MLQSNESTTNMTLSPNNNTSNSPNMLTPSTTPTDYNSYTAVGAAPTEGYMKQIMNTEYGFIPTETGGSDTTYMCEYFYKNDDGVKYAIVGGFWLDGSKCGRSLSLKQAATIGYISFGARLSLV